MEDLTIVDGRDESVGDSSDGLVEVGLGGEDIDGRLRREWGISRDDCGGDRVERNQQGQRLGWHCSGGLVGRVDQVIGHGHLGSLREGSGNFEVKVAVRMEFQL